MTLSRLPARCAHCKAKFLPEERGLRIHPSCVDGWYAANREKLEKQRVAKLRKATAIAKKVLRERKAALKTIPDLIKEAQIEFNKFIRLRDQLAGHRCISSGRVLDWSGNGVDAGHYRSVGAAPHLRFDERNCHAQSKHDNQYRAGNLVGYRQGLIERRGLAEVESLEADNRIHKWTREELISIRDTYRQKRKELERGSE